MTIYFAEDYAGGTAGDFEFYYGYEVTWCEKHGQVDGGHTFMGKDETTCDCDDAEWCFQATYKTSEGTKQFALIPSSKLSDAQSTDVDNALEGLARGLLMVFEAKSKKDKRDV